MTSAVTAASNASSLATARARRGAGRSGKRSRSNSARAARSDLRTAPVHARPDLDRERTAGAVERPDREAGGAESREHRPAADRSCTHAAVAAHLERRLRAHSAERGDRGLADAEVRGKVGSPAARPSPERRAALAEPRLAVEGRRVPQLVDGRVAPLTEEPGGKGEGEVEAHHDLGIVCARARGRDLPPGPECGRPRAGRAARRSLRPPRSRVVRPSLGPTSRPPRRRTRLRRGPDQHLRSRGSRDERVRACIGEPCGVTSVERAGAVERGATRPRRTRGRAARPAP